MYIGHNRFYKLTLLAYVVITTTSLCNPKKFIVTIVNSNNQLSKLATNSSVSISSPQSIELDQQASLIRPISLVFNNAATPSSADALVPSLAEADSHPITIMNTNNQYASLENASTPPSSPQAPKPNVSTSALQEAYSFCLHHKGALLCTTLIALYSTVMTLLVYKAYTIPKQCIWAQWGPWKTYEELTQVQHIQLIEQLYPAIEQHYQHESDTYGFMTRIVCFLRDVTNELALLESFEKMHAWLNRLYLSFLFPEQKEFRATCHQLKLRLLFLKDSLLIWMRNDQNKKNIRMLS